MIAPRHIRRAQLEHDRGFEHPGHGRPEFPERHAQRMQLVSGIAFGPISQPARASSLVRPPGGSSFATAAGLAGIAIAVAGAVVSMIYLILRFI